MATSPGKLGRIRRWVVVVIVCAIVGAVINGGVAFLIVENADFLTTATSTPASASLSSMEGDHTWSVDVAKRFGALQVSSTHTFGSSWSPHQATGQPDATLGSDSTNAWASQASDATPEWLELEYAEPILARFVEIHETYAPGAVSRITFYDAKDQPVVVWEGVAAPAPVPARVFTVPVTATFAAKKIRIDLDSAKVPNWNEIDAVALIDAAGTKHWAVGATASTWYGQSRSAGVPPAITHASIADQIRPLEFLRYPLPPISTGWTKQEQRLVQAFGWPAMTLTREDPSAMVTLPANPMLGTSIRVTGTGFVPNAAPAGQAPNPPNPGRIVARPIWRGVIINTAAYATGAFLLYLGLATPIFVMRQLTRMRDGCCIECGYQLGYDFKLGCPNCGWRRTDDFPPVT